MLEPTTQPEGCFDTQRRWSSGRCFYSCADVPIDALGREGREAMAGGMPVQDGLSMDMVEEGGRSVRKEFAAAKLELKTFVRNRVEDGSQM